jgi:transcriptional regulator with XRE-family HTH domain
MNLGDYIKEKRKQKGLTQLQLSEMLDIDDTTLSRIEKSKRKIQSNQINKISKALNIDEQEFNEHYIADKIVSEYGDNLKTLQTIKKAVDIIINDKTK